MSLINYKCAASSGWSTCSDLIIM
uniref:Uncharacterized protein n=1 Tax=Arundo donax TaxID=35708 RepID=A0A0A9HX46_ARUDO